MRGRVLAVDYGSRRIGLALSDPTGVATQMLPDVRRRGDDPRAAQEVAEVAHRYEVRTIVVGLPLRLDGTEGPQAQAARRFARLLERTAALPVRLWDERLTSVQAERILLEGGLRRKRRRQLRDRLAAALVLRSFLQAQPDS